MTAYHGLLFLATNGGHASFIGVAARRILFKVGNSIVGALVRFLLRRVNLYERGFFLRVSDALPPCQPP